MAYVVRGFIAMAYKFMAFIVMSYCQSRCPVAPRHKVPGRPETHTHMAASSSDCGGAVIAYVVMVYLLMAYIVMGYIVMAYIVMA